MGFFFFLVGGGGGGIFYCFDLNHLVRVLNLFMFSYWLSLETARCCFLFFHLQITGVCYNITSPVTGKSTDLAFKFEKNCRFIPF